MNTRLLRYLAGVLVLAAVYFGAAKLGFTLAFVDDRVTVVWPPTGISLACLLVFGYRLWPGVALGAFLANATSHEPMLVACGIAVGNTLEAVLGAWLLRRVIGFRNPLERLKDVLALIVLAAGVSTTVSATIGAACLCLGGLQPDSAFGTLWWTWWLGDAMGDLVMAPVLLTWATWARIPWDSRRQAESVAFIVVLAMVSIIVFSGANPPTAPGYPLEYTIFPFLIWGALRLGQRGVATGTLVALVIAIVATINNTGPFAGKTPHQSLVQLHIFMAVLAVTSLLLGAATCERRMEERRRVASYTITAVLADAPSLAEAAPRLLQVIGETLDWDVGAVWTLDRQAQALRCVEVWHASGVPIAEFERATRAATFPPGIGLPGRVWASGQPSWIVDVGVDANFPRATAAGHDRLRAGLGFPIVLAADTLAVLEFFSSQRQQRDKDLLRRLAGFGGQIGQFIERRRAEEELRQSQEALRETDRRKDEFLAMLAHELRNPLAPILNSLYILKMPAADPAVAGQAREVIERQVQHLVRLVDDLLDVSRIMRGKIVLRKERLDLSVAIARAVETAQPVIDARGHRLTVTLAPEPIAVDADLVRLAQVIANLLNNAAKYTDPGGEIRLCTERRDGEAVVRVRDTGVGIAADVLPRIFDLFVQADRSLDRAHGGMGVGLTLVRTLVERHGGTVAVSSEGVGRGSEFVVRLPLMPERRPDACPPSDDAVLAVRRDPSGPLLARRVLVVDDNADAADSLAILLRMNGQIVRVVHDGMAALEAAQCEPPDVVFLDLGMPGMNGFEVARRLRQQPATENALLVAVTGWGQAEDRRRTHEAGFDHHLVKPVDAGAVQGLLAQAIAPAR